MDVEAEGKWKKSKKKCEKLVFVIDFDTWQAYTETVISKTKRQTCRKTGTQSQGPVKW